MTTYVVLRATGAEGEWSEVGDPVAATNDRQAIKAATAGGDEDKQGTFVAVPSRSWHPRKRAVETKEVERWE